MAKDKSKAFIYSASVTINGQSHKLHFRKERQRAEFIGRAQHLEGVSNASIDVGIYVYEDANDVLNMVANFANRHVKI